MIAFRRVAKCSAAPVSPIKPPFRPGDFIGFSSYSLSGALINLGTLGLPFYGLSHCGLVIEHPSFGELLLIESTTLLKAPCLLTGKVISGVQAHLLNARIRRYHGAVWHYPLTDPLDKWEARWLVRTCVRDLGISYDALGAFDARDIAFGWLRRLLFTEENLSSLFCSEFAAAKHREVGVFATKNASRWSPNSYGRALLDRGIVKKAWRVK